MKRMVQKQGGKKKEVKTELYVEIIFSQCEPSVNEDNKGFTWSNSSTL